MKFWKIKDFEVLILNHENVNEKREYKYLAEDLIENFKFSLLSEKFYTKMQ